MTSPTHISQWIFTATVPMPEDLCNISSSVEYEMVSSGSKNIVLCEDPNDVINRPTREMINNVLYVGVMFVLFTVGAFTNVINCLVFRKQGLKDRINFCLFSLALVDLLYLTTLFLRRLESMMILAIGPRMRDVWVEFYVQNRLVAIHSGFTFVHIFINILISVERCVCIVSPLQVHGFLQFRAMVFILIVGSACMFGSVQVLAFMYDSTIVRYAGPKGQMSKVGIAPSSFYLQSKAVVDALDSYVLFVLFPCLSIVIITSTTTITTAMLRRSMKWRSEASSSNNAKRKEISLTRMLIAISCVFVACRIPDIIRGIVVLFVPEFSPLRRYCNLLLAVETVTNIIMALSPASNFCVYYLMGSKFRKTLTEHVFICCGKIKKGHPTSQNNESHIMECNK